MWEVITNYVIFGTEIHCLVVLIKEFFKAVSLYVRTLCYTCREGCVVPAVS